MAPGGLNFDAKVRRESTDLDDMFIGHIGAMDTYARGLKAAAKAKAEGTLDGMIKARYASYDDGFGAKVGRRVLSCRAPYTRCACLIDSSCLPLTGCRSSPARHPSQTARRMSRRRVR